MVCSCGKGEYTFKDPSIDIKKLDPVIEKYKDIDGSLITILQKAQELYGYLPIDLISYISMATNIKPSKVLGVVTFYTQFRLEPVGKYLIMLCQGTACHVNGSAQIEEAVCDELKIKEGETTADGMFTLNNVACLGCCSLSPVMMVNDETYGTLTPDKVRKILRDIKKSEKEAAQ